MSKQSRQYLTVYALTEYIKRKFDNDPHLQRISVVGEISNFNRKSNHKYFTIKDEHAQISAVMFASAFNKVKFNVEDGMKVIVTGYISVYKDRGQYQIYVSTMEPDGIGSLYLAFEQLKKKFSDAGLFDLPKKQIPAYPRKIAIITSRSGSVIHDIRTTLERRNPIVQWELFEAKVQGNDAPRELINQLYAIHARQEEFDLIILARGGGSIEDLWAFNNEELAHVIIQSQLPIISSIGHETDTTLADLVADLRAPTPTAAAELAAPVLSEVKQKLNQLEYDLYYSMHKDLQLLSNRLNTIQQSNVFRYPERILESYIQRLDIRSEQFEQLVGTYFKNTQRNLQYLSQQLNWNQLNTLIDNKDREYQQLSQRLIQNMTILKDNLFNRLHNNMQVLDAVSPLKVLERGYAVVTSVDEVVNEVSAINPQDHVTVHLRDGKFTAEVIEVQEGSSLMELEIDKGDSNGE